MNKSLLRMTNFMHIFYSKSLLTNYSLCYTERKYMSINGEIEAFEGSLSCLFFFYFTFLLFIFYLSLQR